MNIDSSVPFGCKIKSLLHPRYTFPVIYTILALFRWPNSHVYYQGIYLINSIFCIALWKPSFMIQRNINIMFVCIYWAVEFWNIEMTKIQGPYPMNNKDTFEIFSSWMYLFALWAFTLLLVLRCVLKYAFAINSIDFLITTRTLFSEGISEEVFKKLPSQNYKVQKEGSEKARGRCKTQNMCAICIEEYQEGEELKIMPQCNHMFHSSCIRKWVNEHETCPNCRCEIIKNKRKPIITQRMTIDFRILYERLVTPRRARNETAEDYIGLPI